MDDSLEKQYGIGAKLLQKMGYTPGNGLGKDGKGIDQPIQVNLHQSSGHMGLGMLNQLNKDKYSQTGFESEDLDTVVISSDDEESLRMNKSSTRMVNFRKSANKVDKFNSTAAITKVNTKSIQLQKINKKINTLKIKIDDLKREDFNIQRELKVLNKVKHLKKFELSNNKTSKTETNETIESIFELDNLDVVDKCLALLLQNRYGNEKINLDQFDNYINIIELIMNKLINRFSQHIEQFNLIKTTIIYQLTKFWNVMISSSDLTVENNYNPIFNNMKRCNLIIIEINELEKILTNLLTPIFFVNLENWDLFSDYQPTWFHSFADISIPELLSKIREISTQKFIQYCQDWYHRDPQIECIDLLKDILGDQNFNQLLREYLLDKILNQVWFKYFDLIYDLTNDNWGKDDSVYALRKIRECKKSFVPKDYKTVLEVSFNEIFKIIYDWKNFSSHDACSNWFNWFVNEVYEDNLPKENWEISLIEKAQNLLNSTEEALQPIHDETLNLKDLLSRNNEYDQDLIMVPDVKKEYNYENISMRLVNNTFKDVVEEYCQLKGYNLTKKDNKYTKLKYGPQGMILVPVFQISNGKKSKNVAIKDDILWVEDNRKNEYIPQYLTNVIL